MPTSGGRPCSWLCRASIVAFATYLIVIRELGADRAGYATVLFPVVALAVSTWLEGFVWTPPPSPGRPLAICGNLVLFWRRRAARPAAAPAQDTAG